MASRRFYCPDLHVGPVALAREQSDHIRRVLRLEPGDTVELFDGAGHRAVGRITDTGRGVSVTVDAVTEAPPLRPWIDVAAAVPKGPRADVLVEKASELGADRWIPLLTERSVVDPRPGKLDRFERLAVESAKQCGRDRTMLVEGPTDLAAVLARSDEWDLRLIADTEGEGPGPGAEGRGEAQADASLSSPGLGPSPLSPAGRVKFVPSEVGRHERAIVLIGPEGGWTETERNAAFSAGFRPWRLGPHVLRIETAVMAALAVLRHGA